jgi:hypothetical protein
VEAEVIRPVSMEGFLAPVQPGMRFELDQVPVSEDFWMPVHFSMKTRTKVLFFFSKTRDVEAMYYGYSSAAPALKKWLWTDLDGAAVSRRLDCFSAGALRGV